MSFRRVVGQACRDWFSAHRNSVRQHARRWTVVCLHEVTDAGRFERLLDGFERKFRLVSLSEGFRLTRGGGADQPLLTLTFDDADRSVATNALPVLEKRGIPGCLFVCTGFVEAGERHVSTGRFEVMGWDELRQWAAAGLELGAHTVNHIPLNQATFERARWEILRSKAILEERVECKVPHFAYPFGYATPKLERWLESDAAFETISTTTPLDNYPAHAGKHVYRKPSPEEPDNLGRDLREPTLYESIRFAHQRSVLTGLAPVVWRLPADSNDSAAESR